MNERRRDRRNPVDVPVTVKVGKKSFAAAAVNVSFKGLAIKLDDPPPVRQLVQLEIALPTTSVSAHAMVVHVAGNVAGLEFFGRGAGPEWDEYVGTLGRTSLAPPGGSSMPPAAGGSIPPRASVPPPLPTTPARPITPPPGAQHLVPPTGPRTGPQAFSGAERRRAPRIPLRLELRLRTPRSIHSGYTTEVSMLSAGILVQEAQVTTGEQVIVNLIQPGTSFSFRRDGTIRRQTSLEGGWVHVGIEFSPLEPMREVLFADFMNVAYATLQGKA